MLMDQKAKRELKSIGNFHARVQRGDPTDCWPWTGTGGRCRVKGIKPVTPQRIAWCLGKHVGSLPSGMDVTPNCGNAECCNQSHLRLIAAKPLAKRGAGMRPLTVDIRADQLAELQRWSQFRTRSVAYLVREALDTAFRLAEGSEGRACPVCGGNSDAVHEIHRHSPECDMAPVAVSENPTET